MLTVEKSWQGWFFFFKSGIFFSVVIAKLKILGIPFWPVSVELSLPAETNSDRSVGFLGLCPCFQGWGPAVSLGLLSSILCWPRVEKTEQEAAPCGSLSS